MTTSIYHNNFIKNKYFNWYESIIRNSIYEDRIKGDIFYENHHILPKSMNGSDENYNLVLLTPKEHYICHHLLTKFTTETHNISMTRAFFMMNSMSGIKVSSKIYEKLKTEYAKIMSEQMKGNKLSLGCKRSDEFKENMSIRMKGNKLSLGCKRSDEFNNKVSIRLKDVPKTTEHKRKLSVVNKGKKLSVETKDKMSVARTGKNSHHFNGYYITPWGRYVTSTLASKHAPYYICRKVVAVWCKNSNKLISNHTLRHKFINNIDVGKTFKQIGFGFEEK